MLNTLLSAVSILLASSAEVKTTGSSWRSFKNIPTGPAPWPCMTLMKSDPWPNSGTPPRKPLMSVSTMMNF